ncbi:hypothetical protein PQX77_001976 [Marasmius sp. AFHP31]|nr:hypothetical protein PQX77_001976 [Marasmius sp. AFHP31]
MTQSKSQLFQPVKLGDLNLSHRVVLAPLTRYRASVDHVPFVPLVKEYYSQRGSELGTLLVTEGAFIHPRAGGFPHVPGIWSDAQIDAWKEIVNAVHQKGSYIYMQLWTPGRGADPEQLRSEDPSYSYTAPSEIPITGRAESPRPMTTDEIKDFLHYYAEAAKNAVYKAGFDGVEIHGANGYLIEQFLKEKSNQRTDLYGGSPENRARFALEVVDAVVKAIGPKKTGLRLSPWNTYNGVSLSTFSPDMKLLDGCSRHSADAHVQDPLPAYSHLVRELKQAHPTLAYIHITEPRVRDGIDNEAVVTDQSNDPLREIWMSGPGGNETENGRRWITAGAYDLVSGTALADEKGDLVAYGRWFISNPDLPYRLKHNIPLTPYERSTFYLSGSIETTGYTDYPFAHRHEV